ncbi:MAG: hypothetical protein H7124_11690, partial [Phycisphaerales bacterium]|nr:hypothetical protein [Hyphomonadaceae bacterium]
ARERRLVAFTAENPEAWRTSFRCGVPDRRSARRLGAGAPRASVRFLSAWPLAERFEAMLRVFNAPQSYAKRLARGFRAGLVRVEQLLRAPADYVHRIERAEEITAAAKQAAKRNDSS